MKKTVCGIAPLSPSQFLRQSSSVLGSIKCAPSSYLDAGKKLENSWKMCFVAVVVVFIVVDDN